MNDWTIRITTSIIEHSNVENHLLMIYKAQKICSSLLSWQWDIPYFSGGITNSKQAKILTVISHHYFWLQIVYPTWDWERSDLYKVLEWHSTMTIWRVLHLSTWLDSAKCYSRKKRLDDVDIIQINFISSIESKNFLEPIWYQGGLKAKNCWH